MLHGFTLTARSALPRARRLHGAERCGSAAGGMPRLASVGSLGSFPVAALAVLAVAGCSSERRRLQEEIAPTREQLVREGRKSYERACASCHGLDGRGDGPVAPTLKVRPPDLTTLARSNGGVFPRDEVIAAVTGTKPVAAHGTAETPVWRVRFGPSASGASAAAALRSRRWLDGMMDYLETIQERS
jgi:mono/diheme cytochrome c family protein